MYYSNQLGHSLCVCAKFAIHCRHVRNYDHWIDLHSTCDNLEDASTVVLPASASLSVTVSKHYRRFAYYGFIE